MRDAEEPSLWARATAALRAELSDAIWNTCFADAVATEVGEVRLVLGVSSLLVKERVESRYLAHVRAVLNELTGHAYEVVVEVALPNEKARVATGGAAVPGSDQAPLRSSDDHGDDTTGSPGTLFEESDDDEIDEAPVGVFANLLGASREISNEVGPLLNQRYTFEDFVIGSSNKFAHAAAMAVAQQPAKSYNPLFIYGDSGLGKTHLLQAIAHYVRQNYQRSRVRYVSTETFVTEFVDAIRTNSTGNFKRRYRDDCDVLLIDDIQFMEGKEGTQEEFFHTFNYLHQSGRQIVISSDRPPKSIATLEDRLRSRFEWGLITDMQPPELETRLAILRKKADSERIDVPDEVLAFIGTNVTDNIRELEGALNRVCAYAGLNRVPLNRELAERVLNDLLTGKEPRPVTAKTILDATADMFGFTVADLVSQSRRRPLVTARQVGMYVFRELTDFSYPMIGREFGNRDHTTVIHAVEKITQQMKERRAIYDQVTELIKTIKQG